MSYKYAKTFGVALMAGLMASPLLAKDYFVAQSAANASDENPGTQGAPWKTINRSLKSIAAGDTVRIGEGVYREQIVLPGQPWLFDGVEYPKAPAGTDSGELISFVGERGRPVVIKGSDIVTGWKPYKDAIWVCDWPNNSQQVFCDGKPLTQIAGKMMDYMQKSDKSRDGTKEHPRWLGRKGNSLDDIEAGSFCVDLDAKKLYVWLADGSDPGKHVIEAGVRTFGICLYYTQYIKLANLSIQQANTSAVSNWGGLVAFGTGFVFENVDSSWNDVSGMHLKGKNHSISNCTFDHNGQLGIVGEANGALIINCQTNYNNRRKWSENWSSGGVKLIPFCNDVLISGHTAAYNNGPGIWFDSWDTQVTIENSRVHNNDGMGIFYEVSERAVIRNNVVYDNASRGIYISNSSNCLIAHNVLYGNGGGGVVITGDARLGPPLFGHPDNGAIFANNNYVYGNIFMDNFIPTAQEAQARRGSLRSEVKFEPSPWEVAEAAPRRGNTPELMLPDPSKPSNQNNVSDYNVFYRTGGRDLLFWTGWGKAPGQKSGEKPHAVLAGWQEATGNDKHSVIVQPQFVDLAKRDFHPLRSSTIFLVPPLPSVPNDADGKRFTLKAPSTTQDARAIEVGMAAGTAAAGPYTGE